MSDLSRAEELTKISLCDETDNLPVTEMRVVSDELTLREMADLCIKPDLMTKRRQIFHLKQDGRELAMIKSMVSREVITEISMLRYLDHPSLPRLLDVEYMGDRVYLLQDWCGDHIDSDLLRLRDVITVAIQLLDLIIYLESRGVRHRGISYENLLFRPEGDHLRVTLLGGDSSTTILDDDTSDLQALGRCLVEICAGDDLTIMRSIIDERDVTARERRLRRLIIDDDDLATAIAHMLDERSSAREIFSYMLQSIDDEESHMGEVLTDLDVKPPDYVIDEVEEISHLKDDTYRGGVIAWISEIAEELSLSSYHVYLGIIIFDRMYRLDEEVELSPSACLGLAIALIDGEVELPEYARHLGKQREILFRSMMVVMRALNYSVHVRMPSGKRIDAAVRRVIRE